VTWFSSGASPASQLEISVNLLINSIHLKF